MIDDSVFGGYRTYFLPILIFVTEFQNTTATPNKWRHFAYSVDSSTGEIAFYLVSLMMDFLLALFYSFHFDRMVTF